MQESNASAASFMRWPFLGSFIATTHSDDENPSMWSSQQEQEPQPSASSSTWSSSGSTHSSSYDFPEIEDPTFSSLANLYRVHAHVDVDVDERDSVDSLELFSPKEALQVPNRSYISTIKHPRVHFAASRRPRSTSTADKTTGLPLARYTPSPVPPTKWERGPGFWRSFAAICIPLLLSALEGSVTNTALPTIADKLNLGTMFSWVATAFLLASTIFQPLYGQLADMWGRKYPMMVAVGVFGIGSAICGWADSGAVLILGRIVQGLGTGGIDLFAELVLCDIVPLRNRGMYTAIKHVVYAIGTAVGPLLGGVFAEYEWRWCFWINIPVCVCAIVILWWWLSVGGGVKAKDITLMQELKKVDWWGTSLLTSSVVLVLVALSQGGTSYPWSHPAVVVPMVIGLAGLIAFPFLQRSKWCSRPIMPPSIFSNTTSRIAFSLTAIHGFVTYGIQFYLPPFFQVVKGSSPTQSGVQVLPTTLVIVVLAAIGGPLLAFWGKYKPIHQAGFASMTLGLGLFTMLSKSTSTGMWVIFQLFFAAGCGIVVSTLLPAVQVELPDTTNGASAGSWAFLRGTGSLFGVAIPGAIFNIRFTQLLPSVTNQSARAQLANGQAYQHASSIFIGNFGEEVKEQIIRGFSESLKSVWIVFVVLSAIGLALTFFEGQVEMRRELNTAYGLKAPKSGANAPWATCPERDSEKAETGLP